MAWFLLDRIVSIEKKIGWPKGIAVHLRSPTLPRKTYCLWMIEADAV